MVRRTTEETSIPILIFDPSFAGRFKFLNPLARRFLSKNLENDFKASLLPGSPVEYIISFFISSVLYGLLLGCFVFFFLFFVYSKTPEDSFISFLIIFSLSLVIFLPLHFIYPSIISRKIAERTERELTHVLRDMWMQSLAGIPLYDILRNIAEADYGIVSKDIKTAVRAISAGERSVIALDKIASETRSESFKKTLWHVTTAVRTGVGFSTAMEAAVKDSTAKQRRAVRGYITSINFFLLIYLLFAAVIPSIVLTFMSLFSVFGIFVITIGLFIAFVILSAIIQFVVVGFMRVSRPEIS